MIVAAAAFFSLPLVGAAIVVTWFDDDWFPSDPPAFVMVERVPRADQPAQAPICGELKNGSTAWLVIKTKTQVGNTETVPVVDVAGIAVVESCPK